MNTLSMNVQHVISVSALHGENSWTVRAEELIVVDSTAGGTLFSSSIVVVVAKDDELLLLLDFLHKLLSLKSFLNKDM